MTDASAFIRYKDKVNLNNDNISDVLSFTIVTC